MLEFVQTDMPAQTQLGSNTPAIEIAQFDRILVIIGHDCLITAYIYYRLTIRILLKEVISSILFTTSSFAVVNKFPDTAKVILSLA